MAKHRHKPPKGPPKPDQRVGEQASECRRGADASCETRRISDIERAGMWVALANLLIAVILCAVTTWLTFVTRSQYLASQRPFVFPQSIKLTRNEPGKALSFNVLMKNWSSVPAIDVTYEIVLIVDDKPFSSALTTNPKPFVLAPGARKGRPAHFNESWQSLFKPDSRIEVAVKCKYYSITKAEHGCYEKRQLGPRSTDKADTVKVFGVVESSVW